MNEPTDLDPNRTAVIAIDFQYDIVGPDGAFASMFSAVESTARAGSDLGYRIVVAADACATTSKGAHEASLASLAMFADIAPTDNLLAALRQP